MDLSTLAALGAVLTSILALYNTTASRDKTVIEDAKWKGSADAKLDIVVGLAPTVDMLTKQVMGHEYRIGALEKQKENTYEKV